MFCRNLLKTESTLPHYIFEESIFDFRYIRLYNIDILKEKWLNYLQTVETVIRRRVPRRLIWVCTVYQLPVYHTGYRDTTNTTGYNERSWKSEHDLFQPYF